MLYIKITLQLLAVVGLLFSLGEMLNFFTDKDRTDFVKIIKEKLDPKQASSLMLPCSGVDDFAGTYRSCLDRLVG